MTKKVKTVSFRAHTHELPKEIVERDPKLPIHKNGADNLYPERIERIINNSATAKPATKLFAKYVLGKGIKELNKIMVGDQLTGYKFLKDLTNSLCTHNGAFIRVHWKPEVELKQNDDELELGNANIKFVISSWSVIPYKFCRIGKKDDKGYHAKIAVYEHWDEEKIKEDKLKLIDVFNPKPEVILSQIKASKGDTAEEKIKNYKGQILLVNPENSIYPLAHIDEAYNQADSENRASIYVNTLMRQGFVGATFFFTPPLMGHYNEVSHADLENMPDDERRSYQTAKDEKENIEEIVKNSKGVEHAGATHMIELEPGDDIKSMKDAIHIEHIESKMDADVFNATTEKCAKDIRKAINQIPGILLDQADSGIFGNSGELLKQAKIAYQEQCVDMQMEVEEAVGLLVKHSDFKEVPSNPKIEKLIEVDEVVQKEENKD